MDKSSGFFSLAGWFSRLAGGELHDCLRSKIVLGEFEDSPPQCRKTVRTWQQASAFSWRPFIGQASTMSFLLLPYDERLPHIPNSFDCPREQGKSISACLSPYFVFCAMQCITKNGVTATQERRASTALAREQFTWDTTNSISFGSMPSSSTSPSFSQVAIL